MQLILLIIPIAVIWFMLKCYRKESEISGTLKYFNVCGRIHTYLTMCFFLAFCGSFIGGIGLLVMGEASFLEFLMSVASGAFMGFLGWIMFKKAQSRCPEHLKKRLFGMMLMAALGMGVKICLFFMPLVWALSPKLVKATDGREYIIDGTDVYDPNGRLIGKYDPSTGEITIPKQY